MMQLQQAVLQELLSAIHILQSQDNEIIREATDLVARMRQDLQEQSKRISHNTLHILAVRNSNQVVQKGISVLLQRIDEVIKSMAAITMLLQNIPSKSELRLHAQTMDDQIAQVAAVNTGLTIAMEAYTFTK